MQQEPNVWAMSDEQRKAYYATFRAGTDRLPVGPPVFEQRPDGVTVGYHPNGVIQTYLPNGAAVPVDCD